MDASLKRYLQRVADTLADKTGEDEWSTVDLDRLYGWGVDPDRSVEENADDLLDESVEPHHVGHRAAEVPKKKATKRNVVTKRRPLAEAARRAGHEPETEEGGRAMMQAITPEHLRRAQAVRKRATLKPGDEIEYTNYTVGGSFKGKAVVTWDHGESVEARTLPAGEKIRLERVQDGSLRRFT